MNPHPPDSAFRRACRAILRQPTRTKVALATCALAFLSSTTVVVAHEGRWRPDAAKTVEWGHRKKRSGENPPASTAPSTTIGAVTTTASTTTTAPPTTAAPAPTTTAAPVTTAAAPTTVTTTAPATTRPAPSGVAANAKYVAPSGDDGAPGTADAPWRSLSKAVSRLNPGDTLYVRAGRYNMNRDEQMNIEGKNGDASRWLTIAAYPGERPVVQLNSFWQGFLIKNASYVEIRGLEIIGTALSDQRATAGVEIREAHHVKIVGNNVHDVGGCGICSIDSNHVAIDGNEVAGASKWNGYQTSGVSFFTSMNVGGGNNSDGFSMYIRNNRIHHNTNITQPGPGQKVTDGNCIIIDWNRQHGYQGSTLVQNNLCYENGGRGVHVFNSDNVVAINNTLQNNLRHADIDGGELTASAANNVIFRNNAVWAARPGAGNVLWNGAQASFDHNVYVGSAPPNLSATDKVVSSAFGADFRPVGGSALIDGSNPAMAPSIDLTGTPRRGLADVGAFEAA